jgi:glycosyltransferase involved in cell wall biosynthesis
MMKILFVAYNFPPEGGPAVQRVAKFIKYLTRIEAKIYVLTAEKKNKIIDETFVDDIADAQVTTTIDYGNKIRGGFKKVFWRLFVPDKSILWKYSAIRAGTRLVKKNKIDLIISTSPPHSTHLIAEKIVEKTGVNWIADFRDEWVDNSLFSRAKNKLKQKNMEKAVLKNCDHIITVTETAKKNFANRINVDKITVIPNGFDEEDFNKITLQSTNYAKEKLVIAYAGRLNELHSPKIFFTALDQLVQSGELDAKKLSVQIIGNLENKKWLKDYPFLFSTVTFLSYMPHNALLDQLNNSDVLLLFATNMNTTEFFPAKMFEYFRFKKNILAVISSKGELWDALTNYGGSYLAIDSEIEQIKSTILNLITDYETERLKVNINEEFVARFSRKNQASLLYELCNNLQKEMR